MRMRRLIWFVGIVVAAAVVSAGFGVERSSAQDEAQYIGAKLCRACHQSTHPDVVASSAETAHASAMWGVGDEDQRRRVVGDFSKDAPFSRDQVAYVLGSGRQAQAYLDTNLKVLPGEWSVEKKAWVSVDSVDGAKECVGCHTTGFNPETGKWVDLGVSCEMCHGPGSVHTGASDKKSTVVALGELAPERRAMVCGQCHSRGKSKDGQRAFPVGYHPGGDLGEFYALDQQYPEGIRNTQYNDLMLGGGKHLGADVGCTVCHEPHGRGAEGAPAQLKAPGNQLCLQDGCHAEKLPEEQHPPAVLETVSCSMCHMPKGKHTFVSPGK